mmetsp:Transcript_77023/g.121621  ORF Transcript_77023/g.121621 Transcript_77023/m.121621 type:complete len:180 (-) Transcript_77023:25-564(-)
MNKIDGSWLRGCVMCPRSASQSCGCLSDTNGTVTEENYDKALHVESLCEDGELQCRSSPLQSAVISSQVVDSQLVIIDESPRDGQASQEYSVKVRKHKDLRLGMRLDYSNLSLLKVTHIGEGIIASWNSQNPTACVEVGDYIVAINGRTGSAANLLEEIATKLELDMILRKKRLRQSAA